MTVIKPRNNKQQKDDSEMVNETCTFKDLSYFIETFFILGVYFVVKDINLPLVGNYLGLIYW